jgi:hypothetical protein
MTTTQRSTVVGAFHDPEDAREAPVREGDVQVQGRDEAMPHPRRD